jgi:hypothetical protein
MRSRDSPVRHADASRFRPGEWLTHQGRVHVPSFSPTSGRRLLFASPLRLLAVCRGAGSRSRDAIPGCGASQVQRAGVGGAARTGRTGEGRGVERPVDNGWARAASPFQAGTKVVIARFVSHRAGWKGLGARGAVVSRAPISMSCRLLVSGCDFAVCVAGSEPAIRHARPSPRIIGAAGMTSFDRFGAAGWRR